MSDRAIVAERDQSRTQEDNRADVSTQVVVDKVVIGSVVAFTGVVGIWVMACLVSAMYQAGGPLQLLGGWFRAVTGL
ncbi:hypothetical protein [Desulfobulbus alkaliphilus]|uniref:hypothetical protein n=1 Tax=Desulfobulbus alkaliphilus TaxID=869814 RepID=UPI0019637460|nr:hypothetical protein [Desulfobulbus alkaliphilus]MBM9537459.1 hypothetical protein [Desulfobulbus alkaliphilus]